jgi:type II secretory pathway pseudopilin PulG
MIRQRKMTRAAFTLLELFVLVPIIVILAGAGGYILTGHPENAKKDLPKAGVANPEKEVQAKRTRRGDYPADFGVLLVPGPDGSPAAIQQSVLLDP